MGNIHINTEVWFVFYSKSHLSTGRITKDWYFECCEKHVTRNVYSPFISIFLAKHFCKITNFYYLKLLIETVDGAVAVSIHDRVIKIIHWHNLSCKSIALGSNQPLRESCTSCTWRVKGGQGVALRTLQPPFADWIEIRDPQSPCFS